MSHHRRSSALPELLIFVILLVAMLPGCVSTSGSGPSEASLTEEIKQVKVKALAYIDRQQYDRAENLLLRFSEKIEKQLGLQHLLLAEVKKDLGFLYFTKGRYARAVKRYETALNIWEKTPADNISERTELFHDMARVYQKLGQISAAKSFYGRAIAEMEKSFGPEDLKMLPVLSDLAEFYNIPGYYSQSEEYYMKCLVILEKHYGPGNLDSVHYLGCIADLYNSQKEYSKAEESYGKALEILKKQGVPDHSDWAFLWNGLAKVCISKSQFTKAEEYVQKSLMLSERGSKPNYKNIFLALNTLESLYWHDNRIKDIEALHERRVKIAEKYYGSEHAEFAKVLYRFAWYYQIVNQEDNAAKLKERAKKIEELV